MSEWEIATGDCLALLKALPDNSFDAMCTDPPAGIKFMGKRNKWDSDRGGRDQWIDWMQERMQECLRVLKPGAHVVVWAIPRTSHWTATALEDAGFEIRDIVVHHFGSGFPKSQDVAAFINKLPGYQPDSDDGFLWDGWGTALKPGSEFWILARKPLSESSIARNVLKWGTGALNIDACRVTRAADDVPGWHETGAKGSTGYQGEETFRIRDMSPEEIKARCGKKGRWPTNLILSHSEGCECLGLQKVKAHGDVSGDEPSEKTSGVYGEFEDREEWEAHGDGDGTETVEVWECMVGCPVAEINGQSGVRRNGGRNDNKRRDPESVVEFKTGCATNYAGDSGGAARYFPTFHYFAKPSRKEREAGLDALADRILNRVNPGGLENDPRWAPVKRKNHHPTVKGLGLMKWLCSMVTPEGGYILDPFAGSGSTGCSAVQLGYGFYGCEAEEEYAGIARARIRYWQVKAAAEKP